MVLKRLKSEKGVSVLELLVVVVIGAILIGIAISQFGSSRMQLQRQNVAREFKNYLERARFDSVRRRTDDDDFANMSQLVLKSPTTYEVRLDDNKDGIIQNEEVRLIDFGQKSNAKILMETSAFPITIRFNRKGHITTDSNGNPISPLFTICSGDCTMATTITPENANVLSISPTGTVAMLYGGDVIPPLAAPNISNISNSESINLWVTVIPPNINAYNTNSNNTNSNIINTNSSTNGNAVITLTTPTPLGNGNFVYNPTPSPTPAPNTTPTPQATPQPTPTPTPQLRECSLNEKPGNPAACQCSAPRTVRKNGRCQ